MRPTKLTMSAFGPYKDKAVLDMDSLGTSGIYLITGETGAGKTTIFDAIVYALYGKTSGDDSTSRDERMIRSKYADDTTPTYVEMEFEVRGKSYRIKRNPEYKRPKSRGEGYTTESAGVEFYLPNGDAAKGTMTSINEQIADVIRVDKNQFCKLAMLAQGDFQKFLLDTTKNKTAILRKVFSTEIFESVQNILKSDVSEINRAYQNLNRDVENFLSDVRFSEVDTFKLDFENAKTIEDKKDILERLVEKDNLNKSQLKEKAELLEKEINCLNESIRVAKRKNELLVQKSQLEQQIAEKQADLRNLKRQLASAEKLGDKQETIIKEREGYREALKQFEALEQAKRELNIIDDNLKKKTKRCNSVKVEIQDIKKRLDEMNDIDKLTSTARENMQRLESIGKELKKHIDAKNSKKTLAEELVPVQDNYTQSIDAYENAYRLYISEQAGILAQELREGKPCAVCGSTTHPHPAELHENAPDKHKLEQLKKVRDSAEKERNEITLQLELANKTIEDSADALNELVGKESFDEALMAKIRNEYSAQQKIIKAQEERKKQKALLEKALPDKEAELSALNESIITLKGRMVATQEKANSIKLEYSDKNEIQAKIDELTKHSNEIKATIEKARIAFNTCNESCSRLMGTADAVKQELESIEKADTDIDLLNEKLTQLNSEKGGIGQSIEELSKRLAVNEKILQKLYAHIDEIAKVEKELMWKKSLSDTANGTIADGKHRKITLENYVLCEYFKRILNRASARLMVMSSGQYDLVLMNDDSNHKSQVGLDVGVIDHHNGSRRSVRSLSGGEKFMASLSLALGLSEEVQSLAGGIQLDTMFVDEGFGSLDSNTLELAMRALNSIADSNRLVGIISHVDALESRISRQIVVTKTSAGGSNAKIIV